MRDADAELVCPSCGAAYVAGIAECSDCHVPLVQPTPAAGLLAGVAVGAGTTAEGAAARGWREALLLAGVAHRIERSTDPEATLTYTLLVGKADRAWAEALVAVLEERPSLEARDAVHRADARAAEAAPDVAEPDGADFDVPDLLPPPETQRQIDVAQSTATAGMVLSVLFTCAAVALSPWWAVAAVLAAVESVRSTRVARARREAWARQTEPR